MASQNVRLGIVAKQKRCMLCDLAIAILEEIAPEFEMGIFHWEVVDVSSRKGVMRHAELGAICKRMPIADQILIGELTQERKQIIKSWSQ